MKEYQFNRIMRWVVAFFAIGAWILSIKLSADGFDINAPGYWYVGIFLGGLNTVLEVVVSKGVKSKTLLVGGLLAYIFGVYTNFVGIAALRGGSFDIGHAIIPAALGIMLECLPEPLLLWCLGIQSHDLFARLGEMAFGKKQGQPLYTNSQPPQGYKKGRGREYWNNQAQNRS